MTRKLTRRQFIRCCGRSALICMSTTAAPIALAPYVKAADLKKGFIKKKLSPYFTPLGDGMIRCDLCPHGCEVEQGERGLCEVRENIGGKYYSLVYANPCAVHVDPVEKKPFFHVLPKTRSFSIATAGCNLNCKFCQNWEISQARPEETFNYELNPDQVVKLAGRYQCHSIASTYVEPTIFFEYMLEIGRLVKKEPILKVMHSNGFINEKPLDELCDYLDAACVDLKGFTHAYYRDMTGGRLQPVLDTLKHLKNKGVHTEIVTLLIPGINDDGKRLQAMCRWILTELGQDTPLHFSRFYPRYKLKGLPPTPVAALEQARNIAMREGLHFVYIGNVADHPGENTYCPHCNSLVIKRIGYSVGFLGLQEGRCQFCNRQISGIWKIAKT